MAGIGDALLAFTSGAAGVINKDAEANRSFMRKQKAKIAESRMIRQEKDHDKRAAEFNIVNKYGTDEKGQYMYAYGIFKDHNTALKAVNSGMFKDAVANLKDPGKFVPYEVAITDDEARAGSETIGHKILRRFGAVEERRNEQRKGQAVSFLAEEEQVASEADKVLTLDTRVQEPVAVLEATLAKAGRAAEEQTATPAAEAAVQGTPAEQALGEFGKIQVKRTLSQPKLVSIEGRDKPVMASFDSDHNVFVVGDETFEVGQVTDAPATEQTQFDELLELRNTANKTPEQNARESWLLAKHSPWKFNSVRNPDGSETTEIFRVDPITNQREDIGSQGKAPGKVIQGLGKAERTKAANFLAQQVTTGAFSDLVVEGVRDLSGNQLEGFKTILAERAGEYLAAGVSKESSAYRQALTELAPAFLMDEGTPFVPFTGGIVFSLPDALAITDKPVVITETGLLQPATPKPSTTTVKTFSQPDARALRLQQLREEQARRLQQQ